MLYIQNICSPKEINNNEKIKRESISVIPWPVTGMCELAWAFDTSGQESFPQDRRTCPLTSHRLDLQQPALALPAAIHVKPQPCTTGKKMGDGTKLVEFKRC